MLPAALTSFSADLGLASSSCLNKVCETICDSPPLCKGFGLSSGPDIFFLVGGWNQRDCPLACFFFWLSSRVEVQDFQEQGVWLVKARDLAAVQQGVSVSCLSLSFISNRPH